MTGDLVASYRSKTVAVTGSNGYLGAAMVEALRTTGARIVAVSRPAADVRTRECWADVVAQADVIVHLAGNTSVRNAALDPDASLRSTVLPIQHLVAAARATRRRPRVVFASTATVYGLTDVLPVSEDTAARPTTVYDAHKWQAEQSLAAASAHEWIDGVSLRLANVYGPSPAASAAGERGVLNQVARLAVAGRDVCLFGDGGYLRDYVYVDDVVRAFLLVGMQSGTGVFNVASGTGTTVRDAFHLVVERAARVTGTRSVIREVGWPDTTDRIEFRQFTASIERMARSFDWRPTATLAGGIDRLVGQLVGQR